MYTPKFELLSFSSLPVQRKQMVLRAALEFLIAADWNYIFENPDLPSLYDFAPQYILKVRPAGLDSWQDIPQTIALQSGDCIAAGTMIATENGLRPIEDVRIGERVQTRGGLREVKNAGLIRWNAETRVLVTENRCVVMATPEHRIWTSTRDWVAVADLTAADSVLEYGEDGKHTLAKVASVSEGQRTAVYDLSVDGWPEFFAGGILVHNCKDFACWRVAELRHRGYDDVMPYIKVSYHPDPRGIDKPMTVYHIQVRIHDEIEDPSALLGMPTQVTYDQLRA
jgi:hypothetical protein